MEVVTYNIQFCMGRDGRFDPTRIIEAVRGADIIALQEVERFWDRSDNVDQARVIADALPDCYWMFGPTIDVLKSPERDGGGTVDNRRRQFGNMILSRHPILSSRNHLLPKYTDPEKFSIQRGVLEATIAAPIGPIRVYSTHLCYLTGAARARQIATILAIHRRVQADGAVHTGRTPEAWGEEAVTPPCPPPSAMLLGDFNMEPDSEEYRGLLAREGDGEDLPPSDFVDAWLAAGGAPDAGATLLSDPGRQGGKRIDYCFVTRDLAPMLASVRVDTQAEGSDHQPVVVRFAAA